MKYSEQTTITVSEDTLTSPNNIRFQDTQNDNDITSLSQVEEIFGSFAANSSNPINFGALITAKYLWIKPSVNVQLLINGSVTPLPIVGGKATKLWTAITSLTLVVPAQNPPNPVPVTILLAG